MAAIDALAGWHALNGVPGLGAVGLRRLVAVFGSPEGVLSASREELVLKGGLRSSQAAAVDRASSRVEALAEELAAAQQDGVRALLLGEPGYPEGLALTTDAPPLLYVRGGLLPEDGRSLAVVGTRSADAAGLQAAAEVGAAMARSGVCVVSGMALGIDGAAHRGALEAGGRTVAVLGSGVLRPYPRRHEGLAAAIVRQGALVAEVPLQSGPSTPTLMARNRLVAGMAKAVVVVQSRGGGGAPVAAKRALALGRPAFFISWEQEPFAEGCRALGALGAVRIEWPGGCGTLADAVRE